MNTIVILSLLVLLVAVVSFTIYIGDKQITKKVEKEKTERIQSEVRRGLDRIVVRAKRFGDNYYNSLMDFTKKMEKLTHPSIKVDLKVYDTYNDNILRNTSSALREVSGKIVINKNLEPRFMTTELSSIPSEADIQLEVALTIDEVKELAEKCRNIKMEVDIEKFRKEKVKKAINK